MGSEMCIRDRCIAWLVGVGTVKGSGVTVVEVPLPREVVELAKARGGRS